MATLLTSPILKKGFFKALLDGQVCDVYNAVIQGHFHHLKKILEQQKYHQSEDKTII